MENDHDITRENMQILTNFTTEFLMREIIKKGTGKLFYFLMIKF
jgi:hypothetical protein